MASKKDKAPAQPVAGGKYKRVAAVTLPVLKLTEGVPVYVKVTGAMHLGTAQKAKAGEKQMEPATLLPVVNVETGEAAQIIAGTALRGILTDSFPGDSYVGRSFEIVKHPKANGKRYNTYSVFEIEA